MYKQMLAALEAPWATPPLASAEEMDRRSAVGRNYVIEMFKRHNDENHDLWCKMQMKKLAIRMLPEGSLVKEKAMTVVDPSKENYPPPDLVIPGLDLEEVEEEKDLF
eukprot:CAMPEP_0172517640 /NCGR_PEP_ID=MMETSP1066-20121228/286779_1 /TAXON_ID=671091 /ORGANISM="Coscinodiscus wailesii, Strain CCMP2513" /LENGTH=106 /DNA_ID=CAMNT_0013299753 /DNA_START=402 /DNA_END=722 /DNA_ORIENTATION=+